MPPEIRKYLFLLLILILGITFFTRNDFRHVAKIDPSLLDDPVQVKLTDEMPISFKRNGFEYTLTPLYYYEISGLVVGKMNYRIVNIDKYDLIYPYDVCLIWGNNVSQRLYKNPGLTFSQDCRWCWVKWNRDIGFNLSEFSNNHLLINDDRLLEVARYVGRGDQIRIKGKLVNVKARGIGRANSSNINWSTSTLRTDSGAGACEIIYVESIEVLKQANVVSRIIFRLCLYILIGIIIWKVAGFFYSLYRTKNSW